MIPLYDPTQVTFDELEYCPYCGDFVPHRIYDMHLTMEIDMLLGINRQSRSEERGSREAGENLGCPSERSED